MFAAKYRIFSANSTYIQVATLMVYVLRREQQIAVDLSTAGHSFFLTGKGGTGKSFVVETIYKELTKLNKKVFVTCSTGIACSNLPIAVGATTLHSFAGIKDGRGSFESLLNLVRANETASKRWIDAQLLVIDEISMLSKHVFESIEYISRNVRGNNLVFGGLQIIGIGDFYQLPPVHNKCDTFSSNEYAFESSRWADIFPHSIELHEVVRQTDGDFVNFLNNVRQGNISEDVSRFVHNFLSDKTIDPNDFGVDFVPEIFSTNDDVDFKNHMCLEELPGDLKYFQSKDDGAKQLLNRCTTTPEHLHLKTGCRVLLTANIGGRLVNGMRGIVTGFNELNEPIVQFPSLGISKAIKEHTVTICDERDRNEVLAQRVQIPLKLGWAISVHKSQGMSLPCAVVNCGREFAPGHLYVAVSRVTSKEGLLLKRFRAARKIPVPKRVTEFYDGIAVGTIKNDCSCCCKNEATWASTEELELIFNEWDEHDIEQEIQNMFENNDALEENFLDLDEITKNLGSDETFSSPPVDFEYVIFLDAIKYPDTSGMEVFRHKVNSIIDELKNENCIEDTKKFILSTWSSVYEALRNTVLNEKKMQRKNFTNYVAMLHMHLTTDQILQILAAVLKVPRSQFGEEHHTVCTNIVMSINSYILNLASTNINHQTASTPLFINVSRLNDEPKGKIRHCGGWSISKEREAMKKRLQSVLSSNTPSVRAGAPGIYSRLALLNTLTCPLSALQDATEHKNTLEVTESRQFRSMGLTHISDNCFKFFLELEQRRVNLINSTRLRNLKDDLISESKKLVFNDIELKNSWRGLFSDEDLETLSNSKVDILKVVGQLYMDVVQRYLNMGSAQFLRDLRRELNVKKTEAHRKKTFEKSKKQELKGAKVSIEDILKDESQYKENSHKFLQTMLLRHPEILKSTVYTKQELLVLCDLYGLKQQKAKDKSTIGNELGNLIKQSQDMRNEAQPTLGQTEPPLARKRFRPSNDELAILMEDSTTDFQSTADERARQFGVSKKQILDWHRRHKNR